MRLAACCLVLLAGCDPFWQLNAKVRSPDGTPVSAAALAITCPDWTGDASLTDVTGAASIGGLGARLPARCTVTIAVPGGVPFTTSFERLCAPLSLDDCYRIRRVEVVLP